MHLEWFLLVLYPILGICLYFGVESRTWKIALVALTVLSLFKPELRLVVPGIMIIGIAIKNSISGLNSD